MAAGRHEQDVPPDGDKEASGGNRRHRRVVTAGAPGSDPTPQPEPRRHADDENDDRLKADKPPHWG